MRAAVFASGNGSNFEALLEKQAQGLLNCEIVCLVADRQAAYARQRARNHRIEERYFRAKNFENKEAFETEILKWLQEMNVDLIILAGYMRFISPVLLQAYPMRIINIHPAWLPEFPGAHGIQDAWNAGVSQSGVTVHYVDEGVDTGPVILQERVLIDRSQPFEAFESAIHAKEYDLFYRAVNEAIRQLESNEQPALA